MKNFAKIERNYCCNNFRKFMLHQKHMSEIFGKKLCNFIDVPENNSDCVKWENVLAIF